MSYTRGTSITEAHDTSSGTTLASNSFNVSAGQFIIVACKWEGAGITASVSDTAGNTYTPLTEKNNANNQHVQLFYVLSSAAKTGNVVTQTLSSASTYRGIAPAIYSYSGSASFVGQNSGAGTTITATTASFTAGTMGFCVCTENNGVGASAGDTGWTLQQNAATPPIYTADRIDNPGGSITAGITLSSFSNWIIAGASFSDGGGGTLTAAQGSYSLTGQTATLTYSGAARTLAASQGNYTLSGQSVGLRRAFTLVASQGSYVIDGSDAVRDFAITCSQGSYMLTGEDTALTYSGAGSKTLTCENGSYALTGEDAALFVTKTLIAAQGAYAFTGQSMTMLAAFSMACEQGSYALTGQDVTLTPSAHVLLAISGSYVLLGQDTRLNYSGNPDIGAWFEQFALRRRR